MTPTESIPDDRFTVPEEEVARRTGLAVDEVRVRRGERGVSCVAKGRGHRIWWTEEAVAALAATLGAPLGPPENPAAVLTLGEKETPPATPPLPALHAPVAVLLTRTRMPNTRIVMGRVEGLEGAGDVTVIVGVGRAGLFVPGMRIRARQREGNLYDYEGNPDRPTAGRVWPRWPGRW